MERKLKKSLDTEKFSELHTRKVFQKITMFVTMSEMEPVGGGSNPKPASPADLVDVDSLASSPASPAVSSNGDEPVSVVAGVTSPSRVAGKQAATPMPLLPTLLFNAHRSSNASKKRKSPSAGIEPASVPSKIVKNPPPGYRTDPGVPPGCFEHSLNILGGRYLLLDQLEGSHLQRCIDVNTKQEFVCKVRKLLFIYTPFFQEKTAP